MFKIDEIKGNYKDYFDANNPKEQPGIINIINFGRLSIHLDRYKFATRIDNINRIIKEGKIQDMRLIDACKKQINEINVSLEDIRKKIKEDEKLTDDVLFHMQRNYDYYKRTPEALKTYQRIGNALIKENVEKLVKYEKLFIIYDEQLMNIYKQLKINN